MTETTHLKALVQARIDALTSETTIADLMLLRKAAAGLGCDESALSAKVSEALTALDPDTSLKDLLLGNKAADLPFNSAAVGDAIYSMSNQLEFERGGAWFVRSGFIQADPTKFDTDFFKEKLVPSAASVLTKSVAASDNKISEVVYGVGSAGAIHAWLTSNGGVGWSQDGLVTVNAGSGSGLSSGNAIAGAFLNNTFVATDGKSVRYSGDGKAWTAKNWTGAAVNPLAKKWIYGNGLFVALYSNINPDQAFAVINNFASGSWLIPSFSFESAVVDCTFHNGYFFILNGSGKVWRTADFVTFELMATGLASATYLCAGNGKIIAFVASAAGEQYESVDGGFTWQKVAINRNSIGSLVRFEDGVYHFLNTTTNASYQGLWTSYNGNNWVRALAFAPPAAPNYTTSAAGGVLSVSPSGAQPYFIKYQALIQFGGSLAVTRDGEANQFVRTK